MNTQKQNYENLRQLAFKHHLSLFGVADITEIKDDFYLSKEVIKQYNRAISLGKRLLDSVIEDIKDRPTHLYFHHYRQLNFFLDRAAFLLSSHIQNEGFQALPIPASQTIDWEKQRGHLSHKKIGYLAGLGWMGRNNLLINPKLGARFRLVTILTNMPLVIDSPLAEDCGNCRKCLPVCPGQAIKEDRRNFDHWACFEKLKEFRKSGIVGQYICGICIKACDRTNKK